MTTQHRTWSIQRNDLGLLSVTTGDPSGLIITATRPEYSAGLQPEQARLIAAAPALLEAAQAVSEAWESDDLSKEHTTLIFRLIHELKAAIAIATGKE